MYTDTVLHIYLIHVQKLSLESVRVQMQMQFFSKQTSDLWFPDVTQHGNSTLFSFFFLLKMLVKPGLIVKSMFLMKTAVPWDAKAEDSWRQPSLFPLVEIIRIPDLKLRLWTSDHGQRQHTMEGQMRLCTPSADLIIALH